MTWPCHTGALGLRLVRKSTLFACICWLCLHACTNAVHFVQRVDIWCMQRTNILLKYAPDIRSPDQDLSLAVACVSCMQAPVSWSVASLCCRCWATSTRWTSQRPTPSRPPGSALPRSLHKPPNVFDE